MFSGWSKLARLLQLFFPVFDAFLSTPSWIRFMSRPVIFYYGGNNARIIYSDRLAELLLLFSWPSKPKSYSAVAWACAAVYCLIFSLICLAIAFWVLRVEICFKETECCFCLYRYCTTFSIAATESTGWVPLLYLTPFICFKSLEAIFYIAWRFIFFLSFAVSS